MLNELKNEIEAQRFSSYTNIEVSSGELLISANDFTGYNLIKEMIIIFEMINTMLYHVEHLNNNIIKVKLK